jgi:SPP1 family predicted phage head-tail adaptor
MTDTTITLIAREITGKDSRMRPIYSETPREILCRDEPVSRSEYFSAGQIGIDPEAMVIINPIEYHGEKLVEYQGRRMTIYRRYERSENEMELYLQLVLGQNGGST